MRIFLSFLLLVLSYSSFGKCEFRSEFKKIVSLSGTTTVLLKELNLLDAVYGVSIFNPVTEKEFSGKVYPGGIFLSQNSFSDIKDAVVFFDESRDLRRMLQTNGIRSEEIKTRNLTPLETVERTLHQLKGYVHDCDEAIASVALKTKQQQTALANKITGRPTLIFYLGSFRGSRLPEMVMANDGVVKFLVQEKRINTYPSELAYVNWSARMMNDLPKETLHIAIQDSSRENKKEILKKGNQITLIYPGSLVPGSSQLSAFIFLFDKI